VSNDEVLLDLVQRELSEGTTFLASKGHPGATLTVTGPDRLGVRTLELGGRFAARPDRSVHTVVEIDPARVGWRLEARLSVWLDADESSATIDLGSERLADSSDGDFSARVLVRRAYVSLMGVSRGSPQRLPRPPGIE
jgi:hypothetical protein